MIRAAITACIASLALSHAAHAQMITAQNPASVVTAMQGAGYRAELTKDDSGDPMIRSSSEGTNFSIFFYNCTKNVDCRTIQFFAGYNQEDKPPTAQLMNDWNAKKRFARGYVTEKGAARIEMDLDLDDGGINKLLFEDNLEYWVLLMSEFEKHIGF